MVNSISPPGNSRQLSTPLISGGLGIAGKEIARLGPRLVARQRGRSRADSHRPASAGRPSGLQDRADARPCRYSGTHDDRPNIECFPAKWIPARVKKTPQTKNWEPPFQTNRNGKGCCASANQSQSRAAQVRKKSLCETKPSSAGLIGGKNQACRYLPLERDEFRFGHILRWRSNWRIRPEKRFRVLER